MNKIETAMSFFQEKDIFSQKPPKNKELNNEFKNIILSSIEENYQVALDDNKQGQVFEEVDRLTNLVEDKRPELDDVEKLTLLDEMFHVKFGVDKFRSDNDLSNA